MAKYIDAEKLKRTLIYKNSFLPAFVVRAIEEAPVADVVQVVRCKDCKHRYEDAEWRMRCRKMRFFECDDDNWFCPNGERKADNESNSR